MGAIMDVIDIEGAYVSTRILNYDTAYVDVNIIIQHVSFFDVGSKHELPALFTS